MGICSQVLDHVLSKELAEAYREAVQAPLSERQPRVIMEHPDPKLQAKLLTSLKQFLV
jgi:hypothetical protein